MALGVLDIHGILEQTIELAPLADRLGYARYWIAEHQPQPSPALLVSIVAGLTPRIRVGTAGILLHYYPPLRTARDFHLLDRAFDGRIDAGFCAGLTPHALAAPDLDGRDLRAVIAAYPERAARFVAALRNTPGATDFDPTTAWHGVADDPPQIWSLGGGARSADLAAALGVRYGYALMFPDSADDPAHVARYRSGCAAPYVAVAVAGVCAETDDAAARLAQGLAGSQFAPRIVGSPATCAAALDRLRARYAADEIVFADLCEGPARARCYELLASAVLA